MIKIGEQTVGGIYLGETRIARIYLGDTPVYYEGIVPSVLPEGYTRLTYIENPLSKGAYFNTGINTSTDIRFQIDFMSYDDIGDDCVIIGGMYDINTRRFHLSTDTPVSGYSGSLMLGDSSHRVNAHLPEKETRFMAKLGASTYTIGENTEDVSYGVFGNYKIYVFALNRRNAGTQKNSHGRLYNLKMFSGSAAICNYIPCKNASNKVGVYDTINGVFKQSEGSDAFVAGPDWGE
jgi:hypothetical protein